MKRILSLLLATTCLLTLSWGGSGTTVPMDGYKPVMLQYKPAPNNDGNAGDNFLITHRKPLVPNDIDK